MNDDLDPRTQLRILNLFSGLGGLELGLELAIPGRTRTLCYVERKVRERPAQQTNMTLIKLLDEPTLLRFAAQLRRRANAGVWEGNDQGPYIKSCSAFEQSTGATIRFTRDKGYYDYAWWSNKLVNNAFHLSISFHDPMTQLLRDPLEGERDAWVKAVFGKDSDYVWTSGPYGVDGITHQVLHYFLLCDPNWKPYRAMDVTNATYLGVEAKLKGWVPYRPSGKKWIVQLEVRELLP